MYFSDASSPSGNSSAVIAIMKMLMPSTPTMYWMPSDGIQSSLRHELEARVVRGEVPEQERGEAERDDRRGVADGLGDLGPVGRCEQADERADDRHRDDRREDREVHGYRPAHSTR